MKWLSLSLKTSESLEFILTLYRQLEIKVQHIKIGNEIEIFD